MDFWHKYCVGGTNILLTLFIRITSRNFVAINFSLSNRVAKIFFLRRINKQKKNVYLGINAKLIRNSLQIHISQTNN